MTFLPAQNAMRLERFDIELSNSENAYFAGQEISGKIVINVSEPKRVNEILLELKGRARTYWTKHSGKSRKHCSHSEPYFLEQLNTSYTHKFTDLETKERILPPGHHEIPFSYTLPKTLPSSFEGDFGHVRYTCRAICERPWDFDIISKCAFTVIGIEDINTDPKLNQPASASESNQIVALCWRASGSVQAELNLSKSGFTPGEVIFATPKVTNHSTKNRKIVLKFMQHVAYKAKTFAGHEQVKNCNKTIIRRELADIAANSSVQYSQEKMRIPALPPKLGRCKIINLNYTMDLEVEATVTCSIPIVICSIPLLSELLTHSKGISKNNGGGKNSISCEDGNVVQVTITNEEGQTVPPDDAMSTEMDALLSARKRVRMPSSILSELYPSMPSPYYRESFFGKCDISEEKDNIQYGAKEFAPKYPFYTD